jgi:hypothetical protein
MKFVEPQEVISFSEPVAKKKRFGFFAEGGGIESKKQAILDFINSFPDKPKDWSEATDDLPELHYDIADEYGSKYDFDFNKISSLRERNLRHKQHAKSLLNKLSDEEIDKIYSKWEETLEDKFEGGGSIESSMSILKEETNQYSMNKYGEPIDEDTFMVSGLKKDDEDVYFRFIVAETVSGKDIKLTPEQLFDVDREDKFAGGGEIQSKIDKLQAVVNSKMLPESVKENARKKIAELEKELHESKETKAEEKAEHEEGGSESKEEKPKAKKPKFKIGDVVGTDKDDALAKKITSFKTNRNGEIIYNGYYISKPSEKFSFEESEIVLLKAPSKPTTRKAPIKKAVAKKPSKQIVDYFKNHTKKETYLYNNRIGFNKGMQSKEQYDTNHEWISKQIDKKPKSVAKNSIKSKVLGDDLKVIKFFDLTESEWNKMSLTERNKLSDSYKAKNKPSKADHKKLVAKLKAKKGGKEYDNRASINPKTGERYKRSESSDKKRDAKPLGKRVSADGNVYYENRLNRGDLNSKKKFADGGEVKGSDWSLNLNW